MGVLKRVSSKCITFFVIAAVLMIAIPSRGFAAPGDVTVDNSTSSETRTVLVADISDSTDDRELSASNGAILSFADASGAGATLTFPSPVLNSLAFSSISPADKNMPSAGDSTGIILQTIAFTLLVPGIVLLAVKSKKERRDSD